MERGFFFHSDSNQSERRPRMRLSKVIHQRMTLALLQRSFKMLQTTQETSDSHTGTETRTQLIVHSPITAASITHTEGETNRALPAL